MMRAHSIAGTAVTASTGSTETKRRPLPVFTKSKSVSDDVVVNIGSFKALQVVQDTTSSATVFGGEAAGQHNDRFERIPSVHPLQLNNSSTSSNSSNVLSRKKPPPIFVESGNK